MFLFVALLVSWTMCSQFYDGIRNPSYVVEKAFLFTPTSERFFENISELEPASFIVKIDAFNAPSQHTSPGTHVQHENAVSYSHNVPNASPDVEGLNALNPVRSRSLQPVFYASFAKSELELKEEAIILDIPLLSLAMMKTKVAGIDRLSVRSD